MYALQKIYDIAVRVIEINLPGVRYLFQNGKQKKYFTSLHE